MKITIPKSEETIKKEERQARIEEIRNSTKAVTLQDIKQLLLDVLDEIKS